MSLIFMLGPVLTRLSYLKTFSSNSMKASFAELQKFVPLMAISK